MRAAGGGLSDGRCGRPVRRALTAGGGVYTRRAADDRPANVFAGFFVPPLIAPRWFSRTPPSPATCRWKEYSLPFIDRRHPVGPKTLFIRDYLCVRLYILLYFRLLFPSADNNNRFFFFFFHLSIIIFLSYSRDIMQMRDNRHRDVTKIYITEPPDPPPPPPPLPPTLYRLFAIRSKPAYMRLHTY